MKRNKKLFVGILVVGIVLVGGWWVWSNIPLTTTQCELLENQINEEISEANYCEKDGDCIVRSFGCPFGCWDFINKNALKHVKIKAEVYDKFC